MSQSSEFQRSLNFFTDKDSYVGFSLTADKKRVFGCGDPRDEIEDGPLKVIVGVMGGGTGMATDRSLARLVTAREFVPIEDSADKEAGEILTTDVVTVHGPVCLYGREIVPILRQIEAPDDFTKDTLDHWSQHHQIEDETKSYKRRISDAAGRHADYIEEHGGVDRVYSVYDQRYPEHPNIRTMRGQNQAEIYLANHHPHIGLDREAAHRREKLKVQAYHTNIGASLDHIHRMGSLSKREKGARSVAHIFREAAVRSVIYKEHGGIVCIEIFPGEKGTDFVEIANRKGAGYDIFDRQSEKT